MDGWPLWNEVRRPCPTRVTSPAGEPSAMMIHPNVCRNRCPSVFRSCFNQCRRHRLRYWELPVVFLGSPVRLVWFDTSFPHVEPFHLPVAPPSPGRGSPVRDSLQALPRFPISEPTTKRCPHGRDEYLRPLRFSNANSPLSLPISPSVPPVSLSVSVSLWSSADCVQKSW